MKKRSLLALSPSVFGLMLVTASLVAGLHFAGVEQPEYAHAATVPQAGDAVGTTYTSQKIAYTDQARNLQAYRLTTWGKSLGEDIKIGHTVGAQDNHQWSNDSSKITFGMKVGGSHFVFVMNIASGVSTLVAKDSNGRGSTFNRDSSNTDEVIFWVKKSGSMDLVAVNSTTFARRTIYSLTGATDASSVSQSMDSHGRWIQAWITGRGSCYAPVCSDRVQSVVFDTRPGGNAGQAIIHPAFPFDPDIQFTLNATNHDLYRDGAMWNPVYTSKAMLDECYPLTAAGKCQTGQSGHRYALYDFETNTSSPWPEWPAHSTWSADGLYTIGDHGVIKLNPSTNAPTCQNANDICATRESGRGLYYSRAQTYGNLSSAERTLGMNQRVAASTNNGRLQTPTLSTVANVPFQTGADPWQSDPSYTLGYAFETDGDGRRQQYSPNGQWLLWRSNLNNTSLQSPPGPDDNDTATRDLFIIEVGPGAPCINCGDDDDVVGDDDDDVIGDDDDSGPSGECHRFTSANPIPNGFGAAYSLFGNSSRMLLAGSCSSSRVEVVAGNQSVSGLVYRNGYQWDGSQWTQFMFSGYAAGQSTSWLGNQGTANVSFPSSKILYVAAYVCEHDGGWKCGCHSETQCSGDGTYYWNLQKYDGNSIVGGDDDDDIVQDDDDDVVGDDDDDVVGPQCGNGTCEGSETGASCPADCNRTGGGSDKYAYEFMPPSDIDLSDSNVVVSQISGLSGTQYFDNPNNWNKILLIVMPDGVFTGSLVARPGQGEFLKARGVFIIGGTWAKKGKGVKESPAGNNLAGGNYMQIKFDRGSPKRPFLWISNLDVASDGNYWGDFVQTGTAVSASNEDEWMDLYMQKTKIRTGSYFWTEPGTRSFAPHSDVFQPANGGWRKLMFADLDMRWYGQTIFAEASNAAGLRIHPDARVEIKDVMFRPMPHSSLVYPAADYIRDGRQIWYFKTAENNGGSVYISTWLNNVFAEKKFNKSGTGNGDALETLAEYFEVYRASRTVSGNRVLFGEYATGGRPPAVDGDRYVTFGEPASPMVSDGEIGVGVRVKSASQLRTIFQ